MAQKYISIEYNIRNIGWLSLISNLCFAGAICTFDNVTMIKFLPNSFVMLVRK